MKTKYREWITLLGVITLFVLLFNEGKENKALKAENENLFTLDEAMKAYKEGYLKSSNRASKATDYKYFYDEVKYKADSTLMRSELEKLIK